MPTINGTVGHDEAAAYYFTYIDKVVGNDVIAVLEKQEEELPKWLSSISEEQSLYRYAPDKWSLREVLNHINDGERVFQHRAFWFARGFETPLPSFDQDLAMPNSGAEKIAWAAHIDEFRSIRAGTLTLFRNLPDQSWSWRGVASDNPVTVRALAYIIAGHVEHHARIVKEKYLK